MVELIVGDDRRVLTVAPAAPPREDVRLDVSGLTAGPLRDVSFTLRAGEILGVGGLVGSGRTELLLALYGALPIENGEVVLDGRPVRFRTVADAVKRGLALLPEERRLQALFLRRSVRENMVVAFLKRFRLHATLPAPSRGREQRAAQAMIDALSIATRGADQRVAELSGGNQQKVVVGRWLLGEPTVLLCDEPTRGVDVGAKAEAMLEIAKLAADGAAVIFVSSDLEEVAHLCHRVLVLREGRVAAELERPVTAGQILAHCYREAA
jgi:ABC-type sugar transport system ATPase subunit